MGNTTVRCPQCHTQAEWVDNANRPFCSDRCRLIDLGNWADETYKVPTPLADNVIPFPQSNPEEEL